MLHPTTLSSSRRNSCAEKPCHRQFHSVYRSLTGVIYRNLTGNDDRTDEIEQRCPNTDTMGIHYDRSGCPIPGYTSICLWCEVLWGALVWVSDILTNASRFTEAFRTWEHDILSLGIADTRRIGIMTSLQIANVCIRLSPYKALPKLSGLCLFSDVRTVYHLKVDWYAAEVKWNQGFI